MAIYMNQHNVHKLVRLLTMQSPLIVWWYAGHFVLDSWADSISLPTNKHFQELSREVISEGGGGRVLSHYVFPFPPLSATQPIFCVDPRAIRRQKKELHKRLLPPTSPLVPFNYCFSFRTKSNPWIEFRKNLRRCVIWGTLNPDNILKIDTVLSI